jgi:hypothetical protein
MVGYHRLLCLDGLMFVRPQIASHREKNSVSTVSYRSSNDFSVLARTSQKTNMFILQRQIMYMYVYTHLKCLVFVFDFNWNSIQLTEFSENRQYKVSWKFFHWEPSFSMQIWRSSWLIFETFRMGVKINTKQFFIDFMLVNVTLLLSVLMIMITVIIKVINYLRICLTEKR